MDDHLNVRDSLGEVRFEIVNHYDRDEFLVLLKRSHDSAEFELWPEEVRVTRVESDPVVDRGREFARLDWLTAGAFDVDSPEPPAERIAREFKVGV